MPRSTCNRRAFPSPPDRRSTPLCGASSSTPMQWVGGGCTEVDEEIAYECDGSVLWDELEVSDCVSDLTESPSTSDSPAGRIGCLIGDGLNFNFSAAAREEGWITVRDNGMGIEGVIELNYELINGGLIEVEESLFHSNWDEISSSNINVSSLEYILGDSDVHDSVPISVALERTVMKDFCDSNQLFNVRFVDGCKAGDDGVNLELKAWRSDGMEGRRRGWNGGGVTGWSCRGSSGGDGDRRGWLDAEGRVDSTAGGGLEWRWRDSV
ncbi:hypothetical protein SASPL_147116 [Salvia splendens]|uniref:Uncharacterized protein n=1 Tax=Salvia splendens TaxID=180675 RepID=A0A8X8WDF8_SALSN|nr:hypothetical protein SASPL_147116 [Salvia splendens]